MREQNQITDDLFVARLHEKQQQIAGKIAQLEQIQHYITDKIRQFERSAYGASK
ncbi:MAG: hypothetical protein MI924_25065 [Chloroflexales bacterium]|nr:hypothetical protein [Chloroflexales bacterium]